MYTVVKLHSERLWLHFNQHGHTSLKGSFNKHIAMHILDNAREIEK